MLGPRYLVADTWSLRLGPWDLVPETWSFLAPDSGPVGRHGLYHRASCARRAPSPHRASVAITASLVPCPPAYRCHNRTCGFSDRTGHHLTPRCTSGSWARLEALSPRLLRLTPGLDGDWGRLEERHPCRAGTGVVRQWTV